MKHLYLIGGTMGVGKTTTAQILKKKLPHSVFLDGDWCWEADPFIVTDETKAMVLDNITLLLRNFIGCTAYENVIFAWVMHEQSIIDGILARLDLKDCIIHRISLVCTEEALRCRLSRDVDYGIRQSNVIMRSLERLPLYDKLDTVKIDVSNISAETAAEMIGNPQ